MQREILNVKLVTENELGTPIEPQFLVTHPEDFTSVVPADETNKDYNFIKEWYNAQEVKPFEFAFPEVEEYQFAETVYPPAPVEEDVVEEVAVDEGTEE